MGDAAVSERKKHALAHLVAKRSDHQAHQRRGATKGGARAAESEGGWPGPGWGAAPRSRSTPHHRPAGPPSPPAYGRSRRPFRRQRTAPPYHCNGSESFVRSLPLLVAQCLRAPWLFYLSECPRIRTVQERPGPYTNTVSPAAPPGCLLPHIAPFVWFSRIKSTL